MQARPPQQFITPNGLTLTYEDLGNRKDPAVILIMGLGAQMTVWPDSLCHSLVSKGLRVVRFDNRDVGLSSALDEHGNPSLVKAWFRRTLKMNPQAPYLLKDMAQDVLHLMDGLGIKKAHIVGASMGGMIGQLLAAKHKKRVLSFTSVMSTAGAPTLPSRKLNVLMHLMRRPNHYSRDAAIRYTVKLNQLIGSPAYPVSEDELYDDAKRNFDRSSDSSGFKRQLVAITATGDRQHLVRKIKAPTLVIHGSDDPIIPVEDGINTAEHIRKSKLKVIDGMGHNIPEALVPKISKMIVKHVRKVEKLRAEKKQAKKEKSTDNIASADLAASNPSNTINDNASTAAKVQQP